MRRLVPLAFLVVLVAGLLVPLGQAASSDQVVLVHVTGTITRGTTLHIEAALEEAEDRGVPLVLRLDTPGGLVDATLDIDEALANAEVPVLTFVGPRSAFAASAGTFITLMGHPSGMAPGTTIGSAQPITVGPGGGTQPASEKVENFLVGRIQAIAERTGRDPDIAARFITDNLNLDAEDARDAGMVDEVQADLRSFLDAVDGRSAHTASGDVVLETRDARIVEFDKPLISSVVDILGNPQIAFVLVLAGTYAVVFGLANPGSYVPEVLGTVVLVLGFIGLGLFDTNTAGIILLLLAVLFFVVEVFTPTHGVLTGAGVVALLFAAVFLLRSEPLLGREFLRVFYFAGLALAVTSGAITFAAVRFALKAHQRPVFDSLSGAKATVLDPLAPDGRVTVHGEVWNAHTDGPTLLAGTPVVVVGHSGLTLEVRAVDAGSDAEE